METETKAKKQIKIFGISLWRIFAYFIIYSIMGYIIETTYGAVTKGVIESRKSFLYGPFCAIYGVGAVVMIVGLQKFKKNHYLQFIGGFIIGSIVEYLVSLVGELILDVKWWDYSSNPFNINGRICLGFSFFWGILGMYLIGYFNPKIDKLIDKIVAKLKLKYSRHVLKVITILLVIIMIEDCIITGVALKCFRVRKIKEYDLDVENKEEIIESYYKIYGNKARSNFINKYWNDKVIIKTFPNLKVQEKNGNIIYFDTLVPGVQPYYFKIYNK